MNSVFFPVKLHFNLVSPIPPSPFLYFAPTHTDVWNVDSHAQFVCKSHGNEISLIPGGFNKVAFVCWCVCCKCILCLSAYATLAMYQVMYCNAAVSLV